MASGRIYDTIRLRRGKGHHLAMPRPFRGGKRSLAYDLRLRDSPGSVNTTKHVVLVMDRLKEFSTEPLVWALENILEPGSVVTLLGVMPWLNIPLWLKISKDIWSVEFEELSILKEKNEWKGDVKYLKLQEVVDLCQTKGVVPKKEVVMGYPLRLLVVESVTSLHATWVIFDRYHKKNREFYAEKIPCNMVMMNEDGDGDMIRGHSMIDNMFTPGSGESPASLAPTPLLMISEDLKEILKEKVPGNHDDNQQEGYDYVI